MPCASEAVKFRDESAEVSRGRSSLVNQRDEGPNMVGRLGAETSTNDGDAHRKAAMPEDSRMVAGGTRKSTERERQTFAAAEENTYPQVRKPRCFDLISLP